MNKKDIRAVALKYEGTWHVTYDMDRRMDGPCGGCSLKDRHAPKTCRLCMDGFGTLSGRFRVMRMRDVPSPADIHGTVRGLVVRMDGRWRVMRLRDGRCTACSVPVSRCGPMTLLCGRMPGILGGLDPLARAEAIDMALGAEGRREWMTEWGE